MRPSATWPLFGIHAITAFVNPSHQTGGRASKDGLAVSRLANAMTHLYVDTCKHEDPYNVNPRWLSTIDQHIFDQ